VGTLRDIAPYIALGAAALAAALLITVVVLAVRLRRLRRAQTVVLGRHDERDIVAHTEDLDSRVRNLREAVEILTDQLDEQRQRLDRTLTHHGIVRYDAFRDTGGEQSASFALLDTYRSGVVISAITARDFTRFYVKHVIKGVADRDLSPEEAEVMKAAVPRPLAAGEESPRARRAPLPEDKPPAALDGETEQAPPADADTPTAAVEPPAEAVRPSPAAAAAFEALGEAVDGAAPPSATDDDAPADAADFGWEPPSGPPRGDAPRR